VNALSETRQAPEYAQLIVEGLKEAGVSIVTALPESLLKSVYRMLDEDPSIRYVLVANEAEMPGIAAGAYLGGKKAVMIMENSGLRQALEPIARFALSHQVPLVMMMAYRGDFGERTWWGHSHAQTMEPILEALRIPYRVVRRLDEIKTSIAKAVTHADSSQYPTALIFADDCLEAPRYAKD
jgi:sulfopyruvate decarboxylase subunit alpha